MVQGGQGRPDGNQGSSPAATGGSITGFRIGTGSAMVRGRKILAMFKEQEGGQYDLRRMS